VSDVPLPAPALNLMQGGDRAALGAGATLRLWASGKCSEAVGGRHDLGVVGGLSAIPYSEATRARSSMEPS
jgi:hypothetical protein